MGLSGYRSKRSFNKTPEPTGGKPGDDSLIFVIQKHDASHLHYDFRLEMEGVLKSWAVPKGPSTDPSVKRLAMMVEDHPYDYRNFEGIIPKGQYGGGTVIVWDQGTYLPAEGELATKKERNKNLLSQLYKGKIVITLKGEKLKGDFALVKSSYQGENSWLLMKVQDKFAKTTDILKKDKSVISGKTIAEMEKDPDKIYGSKGRSGSKAVPREDESPSQTITSKKAKASDLKKQTAEKIPEVPEKKKSVNKKTGKATVKKGSKVARKKRTAFIPPGSKNEIRSVNGQELKFTNLDKVYWPKEGITKREVINYYESVAAYIMPYLKDRPPIFKPAPEWD